MVYLAIEFSAFVDVEKDGGDNEMDEYEEGLEALSEIFNLCESEPDAGLEWIGKNARENPKLEIESNVFLKLCEARAYYTKGLRPLKGRPFTEVEEAEPEELRLYVNDENLNCLELALQEIRQIEDTFPDLLKWLGQDREAIVDEMAFVLERCRPGRVQQILGKTKLYYFGGSRIGNVMPEFANPDIGRLSLRPEELRPFLLMPFSFPSTVKSAVLVLARRDTKGRRYIECSLLAKALNDFAPDETINDAKIGEICLFDDGTFRTLR